LTSILPNWGGENNEELGILRVMTRKIPNSSISEI
jgi:hypothetical protein